MLGGLPFIGGVISRAVDGVVNLFRLDVSVGVGVYLAAAGGGLGVLGGLLSLAPGATAPLPETGIQADAEALSPPPTAPPARGPRHARRGPVVTRTRACRRRIREAFGIRN
jgi:hypothetical protein